MRQVMVRVPRGCGERVLEMAERHQAVNVSRWETAGAGDERYEMAVVHLPNDELGPFADRLEEIADVHLSMLDSSALALRPPASEAADQTTDVTPRSPLEVFLAGLQSIGAWKGFLGYAAIAGVVVWIGLTTNSVPLLVGAMLIAPFASPAVNSALATARGDGHLLARSLARYAAALAVTIAISALLTLVFRHDHPTREMVTIANVAPIAFLLPLAAGAAGALTLCQTQHSSLVSGAGAGLLVAASLAPPAGVVGISAALGRWDLAGHAAFLLGLQLVGIELSGAAVFRVFGVGPRGRRFPHGSRWASRGVGALVVLAFGGLLYLQLGTEPPTLVRAGEQNRARTITMDVLQGDADVRLLDVNALFPRPGGSPDHPLMVSVNVERRPGAAPADSVKQRTTRRVADALASRLPRVRPVVDVTVFEPAAPPPR